MFCDPDSDMLRFGTAGRTLGCRIVSQFRRWLCRINSPGLRLSDSIPRFEKLFGFRLTMKFFRFFVRDGIHARLCLLSLRSSNLQILLQSSLHFDGLIVWRSLHIEDTLVETSCIDRLHLLAWLHLEALEKIEYAWLRCPEHFIVVILNFYSIAHSFFKSYYHFIALPLIYFFWMAPGLKYFVIFRALCKVMVPRELVLGLLLGKLMDFVMNYKKF